MTRRIHPASSMDLNQQRVEIEQFLLDVREHIKASLETSEYENTSNLFHVTEAESSLKLLQKCEQLLEKFADRNHNNLNRPCNESKANSVPDVAENTNDVRFEPTIVNYADTEDLISKQHDDAFYLDMTAARKASTSQENIVGAASEGQGKSLSDYDGVVAEDQRNKEADARNHVDEEPQLYDICHVSSHVDVDESQRAIASESDQMQLTDCPFLDLPAGHLSIQKSTKYGQLQRIEKRLFFDQSKKCYGGIIGDWLLCYMDGPTSSRPNVTLFLKSHGVEVEHSGDGKRREVCFQIITADPSKKYVFQAANEVDAKEWIHAIDAAIRGDCAANAKGPRKLPTPPITKRLTFASGGKSDALDYIYEEPSPRFHVPKATDLLISQNGNATAIGDSGTHLEMDEQLGDSMAKANKFEYDVPKSPPQPLKIVETEAELEVAGLLESDETIAGRKTSCTSADASTRNSEKLPDFQTKVKDVHSKLSSQLSAGPSLKKSARRSYAPCSNECDSPPVIVLPSTKELKKLKKGAAATPATGQKVAGIGKTSTVAAVASEKSAKNWFLNRLNKSTSSIRSSNTSIPSPAKCRQSEKENLLSNLEIGDCYDGADSNPASPILKGGTNSGKSKVNMIINQFESSGHLAMFSVEALAGNAVATFSSFCESDCNNYEPIMTISTPPSSFLKKV